MIAPGLYVGDVMHRRLRPRRHAFRYSCFWFALDLDALEETARRCRLFSLARFNLFSFFERDHADGEKSRLAVKVRSLVRRAGMDASGPLTLLTMPRVLGFVFNPLSVYFCHSVDGRPSALVWEVSNTFGERHSYVLGVDRDFDGTVRQRAYKELHVSPFIDMTVDYSFRVVVRGEAIAVGIVDHDSEGVLMTAALSARHRALDDRALLATFLRIPLVTMKVVAAIHWEALRLWLKGVKFRRTPAGHNHPVAAHTVSAGPAASSRAPGAIA